MNMENLEFCQETLMGQPVSEIPPNPPLEKGGRSETRLYEGDFWQGRGTGENRISWLRLCPFTDNS